MGARGTTRGDAARSLGLLQSNQGRSGKLRPWSCRAPAAPTYLMCFLKTGITREVPPRQLGHLVPWNPGLFHIAAPTALLFIFYGLRYQH